MESRVIVCPRCGRLNRAPLARLEEKTVPQCGNCQSPLFDGHPVELASEAVFDRMIERNEIPVLVDFWASWCGPCRAMAPQFEAAAKQLQPLVRLAKVDTEAVPSVAGRFAIRSIPTLILFRQGREIARQAGAMDARSIVSWLQRASAV